MLLEQEGTDKVRHPVAYVNRPTNNAEMKYAPTEVEVAALVYALEHFQVCVPLGEQGNCIQIIKLLSDLSCCILRAKPREFWQDGIYDCPLSFQI